MILNFKILISIIAIQLALSIELYCQQSQIKLRQDIGLQMAKTENNNSLIEKYNYLKKSINKKLENYQNDGKNKRNHLIYQ